MTSLGEHAHGPLDTLALTAALHAKHVGQLDPTRLANEGDDDSEYYWVTDSDDSDPDFECNQCGQAILATFDRYHCETCGDYDLVSSQDMAQLYVDYGRRLTCGALSL